MVLKRDGYCHHLKLNHLCHSHFSPKRSHHRVEIQTVEGNLQKDHGGSEAIKQPGWNVNVWRGVEDFCLGEVECQYLGGVHNSTHKSNPNPPPSPFSPPREQRNSFHERASQINEPIVVVMTSGEQLLPFGVFMDSVKKAARPFLPPNISTSYICISGPYQ